MIDIQHYWDAVLAQDADAIRGYFAPDAYINWHNTKRRPMCIPKTILFLSI